MREAALCRAEEILQKDLAREHGSPFIGHHDIPAPMRQAAEGALVTEIGGEIDNFLDCVTVRFPLLAVWTVATTLAERYGAETDHAIYGLIANRLGIEIHLSHHRSLNDRFRWACNTRGLILPSKNPGRQDLIGDYLCQAGIPVSQLDQLVRAFLSVEGESGLPYCDDTEEVKSWEERGVERVPAGLRRLRKTLGEDSTGYHATVYVRLRKGEKPETYFERLILRVITRLSGKDGPALQPPCLTFGDGDLRLEATSRGQPLVVHVNTHECLLRPQESSVLSPPWPNLVHWRTSDHKVDWRFMPLFSDPRASILLFDGDSGRLKGELNPAPRSTQRVPTGSISLVSKRPFKANGEDAYQLGEDAYVLYPEPSTTLCINQENASYNAQVDPRLRLEVDGYKVAHHAEGLLLAEPRSVFVRGDVSGLEDNLEIELESGANGIRRAPVMKSSGNLVAPLCLPACGPFEKVRISLHVKDQRRALYRHGFWYWPSLRGLCDGAVFDAVSIPENLATADLEYIASEPNGRLTLRKDVPYLRAILAFSVDLRVVSFAFPPPGVSMFVRTSSGDECPLSTGIRLRIKQDQYASHLIVRYPYQADIDFKGNIIPQPFDKFGLWRKSFAALDERGSYNVVRLLPQSRPQDALVLVQIEPDPAEDCPAAGLQKLDDGSAPIIKKHRLNKHRKESLLVPPSRRRDGVLRDDNIKPHGLIQEIVYVNRTLEVTNGSPRYSFSVLMVVGDRNGHVGYGFGRGYYHDDTVRKSTTRARRNMTPVPRRGNTISDLVNGSFNGVRLQLIPAAPGTGIVVRSRLGEPVTRAIRPVRAVMKAAEISDLKCVTHGEQNAMSVLRAVFNGFSTLMRRAQ